MYASRQVAVKGSHNEIPMVINDHVMREIQSFQTLERDFFIESYSGPAGTGPRWSRR